MLAGGRGPKVVSDFLNSRLAHCLNASAEPGSIAGPPLHAESSLSAQFSL